MLGKGSRPRIGVTTSHQARSLPYACVSLAIYLAGGRPCRLTPRNPRFHAALDGLVICGGTDIHPSLYGSVEKINYLYDRDRDALEAHWLKRAEEQNLPVLGICRGAQLINVMRGGNLHMDIRQAFEEADYPSHLWARIFFRKKVLIKAHSLLHRAWGHISSRVNSLHSQAIDVIGGGLMAVAREGNGIIQAVEDPGRVYFLGVQFHPEFLIYRRDARRLFKVLVRAARQANSYLS